jgi:thioredoxin 1
MVSEVLSQAELESLIEDNGLLFIDFWAEWCAPCKHFSIIYEDVARQYPNIQFVKVNIELHKDLVCSWGILSIPHLMVIKEGLVIYSDAGTISASILNELVHQALQFNLESWS